MKGVNVVTEERPPYLRLAAENDQRTIDQEWARGRLRRPLRELAANVIRVVRGAGRSYEIAEQCIAVIEAYRGYFDKVGSWPAAWEVDQALAIGRDRDTQVYDEAWERAVARETILRGSLQVAASRLVGQNTQENRGRSELMEGVNSIIQIREEARMRRAEEERAQRQAERAKRTAKTKPNKSRSTGKGGAGPKR